VYGSHFDRRGERGADWGSSSDRRYFRTVLREMLRVLARPPGGRSWQHFDYRWCLGHTAGVLPHIAMAPKHSAISSPSLEGS
jgi:hypothetical protein